MGEANKNSARLEELHNIKGYGVIFDIITNPIEIIQDKDGWIIEIKRIKMKLGSLDWSEK